MITFITGNKNKFKEISAVLNVELKMFDVDLEEIQELDTQKIIEHKLTEARKQVVGAILIEDTSLYLDCLPNLPGPLIKWFLQSLGCEGLYQLTSKYDNFKATAKTILGYSDETGEVSFFFGICEGTISAPKGETNFGWDPIFMPNGFDKTFAEMDAATKQSISMRTKAVEQLNKFLNHENRI